MNYISAKKSLGQNFLKDETVLKKIADSFEVTTNDLIIEIGPGKGALTKYLIKKSSDFIGYEIDERMKEKLVSFQSENSKIIFTDFLNRNIKADITKNYQNIYVIANIPYYITTPIIEHLLDCGEVIKGMTLLVQKEVADRFTAQPKSSSYGYFTVYLNHFYMAKELFDVPPESFNPSPKVSSTVVQFQRKTNILSVDLVNYQKFLKRAFAYKRKTLKNNLKDYDWNIILTFLEKHNKTSQTRAEELSEEEFRLLFQELYQAS